LKNIEIMPIQRTFLVSKFGTYLLPDKKTRFWADVNKKFLPLRELSLNKCSRFVVIENRLKEMRLCYYDQ